jgi:hypothetical protein
MYRCRALSSLLAPAFVAVALHAAAPAALAQVQRNFPAEALRGELRLSAPPQVQLNGKDAQLAPGVRIRGENNLVRLSATISAEPAYPVLYTLDPLGLVLDVWMLREEEAKRFWPRSREEAATHRFDPAAQSWTKL